MAVRAEREQVQRNVETQARKGTCQSGLRLRQKPVRAVWLEGGMMMSRREAALRAG
ncbi:hypothetical protein GCM10007870_11510 [Gluconobacter kondonii]|uniref:Transposase n=1 Tax=Gluconobacter kondonii TaxID=941463 RepID=A0ABQ5WR99_9PROT|nr:hypothetical protein GCM10007870_11510 [Gluconobacter kondonii]